jgi:hypothetical protein
MVDLILALRAAHVDGTITTQRPSSRQAHPCRSRASRDVIGKVPVLRTPSRFRMRDPQKSGDRCLDAPRRNGNLGFGSPDSGSV